MRTPTTLLFLFSGSLALLAPQAEAAPTASARAKAPRSRTSRARKGRVSAKARTNKRRRDPSKSLSEFDQQQAQRRGLDPKVAASAVAILREYADTGGGPMARSSSGHRRLRKAAQRIVSRIDGLPRSKRREAFDDHRTDGKVEPASVSAIQYGNFVSTAPVLPGLITLPPQEIPPPEDYDLNVVGVHTASTAETDGTDELLPIVAFFSVGTSGKLFPVESTRIGRGGTMNMTSGDTSSISTGVLDGVTHQGPAVVLSAMFEADDDASQLRAEFDAMLQLAGALSDQLTGPGSNADNGLANLMFALDYSVGMLGLSDPGTWGPGTVVVTPLPEGLRAPGSAPELLAHGIEHKFEHAHTIGSGAYSMYLDIPTVKITLPNLRVVIEKVEVLDGVDPGADQDDLTLTVAIGYAKASRTLEPDTDLHLNPLVAQRRVSGDRVGIRISLSDFSAGSQPEHRRLDVNPRNRVTNLFGAVLDENLATEAGVDMSSKTVSGDVSGEVGQQIVTVGDGWPRARVTFRVLVQD